MSEGISIPVITDLPAAPENLLKHILCACKKADQLYIKCGCSRYRILCSINCKCRGECSNGFVADITMILYRLMMAIFGNLQIGLQHYSVRCAARSNQLNYSRTHVIRILRGPRNLSELHDYSNYRSSDYMSSTVYIISNI